MLRASSLASGSKGNCLFVQSECTNVIVDAGINLYRLEKSLKVLGTSCQRLDGVLITHMHSDHTSGVVAICKKYGINIYCHSAIAAQIGLMTQKTQSQICEFFDDSFIINDLTVSPFTVQHDVHCQGFSIAAKTKQLSIATDLGHVTDSVIEAMQGSDLIFVESNYEFDMLHNGRYPEYLKRRILSDKGHLSNQDCSDFVSQLVNLGTKQFVLSHLSQNNNYPELAFSSVVNGLKNNGITEGKDCFLEVAEQDRLTSLFQIG
jgi:phosphoribosyl 1,2-cyclic phosphodiesterase